MPLWGLLLIQLRFASPVRHWEVSARLVNLISGLKLHAAEASQSKQTSVPKREVVKAGSEGPRGQQWTTLVADH